MNQSSAYNFLAAAHVASELYRARTIAEELSITSKNARALAVRAGTTAAGFNEITNFIEGLAKMTIETANRVNNQAVELTRCAALLFRTNNFFTHLQRVMTHEHCQSVAVLKELLTLTQQHLDDIQHSAIRQSKQLTDQLNATQRDLRSTKIVTVVARVESARADESVQESLNTVADRVADAGERINTHIRNALRQLNEKLDIY